MRRFVVYLLMTTLREEEMEKKEKRWGRDVKKGQKSHPLPTNFIAFLTFSVAIVRVYNTLPLLLISPYLHLFTPNYPNLYHIT